MNFVELDNFTENNFQLISKSKIQLFIGENK